MREVIMLSKLFLKMAALRKKTLQSFCALRWPYQVPNFGDEN